MLSIQAAQGYPENSKHLTLDPRLNLWQAPSSSIIAPAPVQTTSSSELQRNTKFILKSAFFPQDECRPAKWEVIRLGVHRVFLTYVDTKSLKFAEPRKALQEPAMMGPHGAGQGFLYASSERQFVVVILTEEAHSLHSFPNPHKPNSSGETPAQRKTSPRPTDLSLEVSLFRSPELFLPSD